MSNLRTIRLRLLLFALISSVMLMAEGTTTLATDLSVEANALVNGVPVREVLPGQLFYYNITVSNKDPVHDVPRIIVMNKLPYEVAYIASQIYPSLPQDYSIDKAGDIIKISFDAFPKDSAKYINISVTAPREAPTTLYNIVYVGNAFDGDPGGKTAIVTTYVPLEGYGKTAATKSFEDLLHNQSTLLFGFQRLLMEIPQGAQENYTFTASFEDLLRSQAHLTDRFETLLANESNNGWDMDFKKADRTYLLKSYEQMLRDEAHLFAGFEAKIVQGWQSLDNYTAKGHSTDAQWEFLMSLEDLLQREKMLYISFVILFQKVDENTDPQERQDRVDFLASLEDLLRVQSNLILGLEDIMGKKFEQIGNNSWEEYSKIHSQDTSDDYDYRTWTLEHLPY